jgi:putative restriction endonuclease
MMKRAAVALTDKRWFDFLRTRSSDGHLDEVNFWRPKAQTNMRLDVGAPVFFRLKDPFYAIAGYGFFSASTHLPIHMAWEFFEEGNGDPSLEAFASRIGEYRKQSWLDTMTDPAELTCIVLRDALFFEEADWISWGTEEDWSPNIVAYKTYDLDVGVGHVLAELVRSLAPADLASRFVPLVADERVRYEVPIVQREGQGAFRVRLLDAYSRRCAVTGERSLPVLDAAHIQRYLGAGSNHVQNGIVLRSDIHRLFDAGYVTVTPDFQFKVSPRLKDEYANGRAYYAFDGAELAVLPASPDLQPSKEMLAWHGEYIFR